MADHLPRFYGPPILSAAYVFSRLFCRDLRRSGRNHGYERATLEAGLEGNGAVTKRVKGMVLAHAHAFARIELGGALAHDHIATGNGFTAEQLDAQHLGVGIATVARGPPSFLVRHDLTP